MHPICVIMNQTKENAALIAMTAADALKEMKDGEEHTIEAYEAACNEMVEAYTKKMEEMKEMAGNAGHSEESEEEA